MGHPLPTGQKKGRSEENALSYLITYEQGIKKKQESVRGKNENNPSIDIKTPQKKYKHRRGGIRKEKKMVRGERTTDFSVLSNSDGLHCRLKKRKERLTGRKKASAHATVGSTRPANKGYYWQKSGENHKKKDRPNKGDISNSKGRTLVADKNNGKTGKR